MELTIAERQERYMWAMTTYRLGQSGNRAGLHAELHRQENAVIDLLHPDDQARFRSTT